MYMTSIDTLAFARELQTAEFSQIQAEALTRAIANHATIGFAAKADLQDFATKKEFAELDRKVDSRFTELDRKIDKVDSKLVVLEQKMDLKLDSLEKSLTIKLGAMMAASAILITTILKLMT
jgi:hypothetical protein